MSTDTGIPPPTWFREVFVLLVPSLLIPAFFLLVRKSRSEPNPYIYQKLGRNGVSNLSDEQEYSSPNSTESKPDDWKVKALMCHPIKSCRGIELNSAKIDGSGILWDRKFVIAEWKEAPAKHGEKAKSRWMFRTLRAPGYENLARVKTEIWLRKESDSDSDGLLIVSFPFIPTGPMAWFYQILMSLKLRSAEVFFEMPLTPPKNHDYPKEKLELFDDSPIWLNYGRHVPASLQTLVQAKGPVTLFRVDPSQYREVHGNAPKAEELGYQPIVGGADSYPLSIQNLASVRAVAREIQEDIPSFTIRRLRPNIIASGGAEFDEDDWQRIQIGEHEIICSCRTTRCKLPCVDPDSAIRHPKQPEAYLRKNRNIDKGAPNTGCLGLQMLPATDKQIEIKVGDAIKILERGEHHFIA